MKKTTYLSSDSNLDKSKTQSEMTSTDDISFALHAEMREIRGILFLVKACFSLDHQKCFCMKNVNQADV